jgi:hypothetical protein
MSDPETQTKACAGTSTDACADAEESVTSSDPQRASGSIGLTKSGLALDVYIYDRPCRRTVIRFMHRMTIRCRAIHDALSGMKEQHLVLKLLRDFYRVDINSRWRALDSYPRGLMHAYVCALTKPGPYHFQTKSQLRKEVPGNLIRWDDWSDGEQDAEEAEDKTKDADEKEAAIADEKEEAAIFDQIDFGVLDGLEEE